MTEYNDDRVKERMLSFDLLSSVHGESQISVDLMEQSLLFEHDQPSVKELQLKRQYDDLMAENCELKHRLTLAKVTSATLQAKHDTLRHNFVTLHRVAVSKLRQRDAEIGVLRKSLQQLLSRNSSSPSISVLNLPNSVEVIELSGNAADGRMPVASRNEVASRALHDESGDLHNNRNMGLTEMETEVDSISAVGIQRPQNANVNCSQFSPDNVSCSRAAECESGIQSSLVTIADISCQPSSGSGNNTDTADSGSQMKKSSESTNSAQRLKILDVQANSEQSDKRKSSSNIGKDKKSCMKNKTSGNRLSSFCEKSVVTGEYADKKQMPIGRTGINTDDVSVCEVAPPRKSSAVENGKQDTVPVLEAGIVPVKFESANLMGSIAAVTVENCVLPNSGDTKDISLLLNGAEERVNSSKKLEKVPKASQTMADKFCAAATAASKSESTVTACDASNKENSKLADSRSERCAGACLEPLQQVVGLNEKSECHPALTDVEINCSAPVKSRKEKGPACPAVVSMQVDKTDQSFVPDVNEGNGPNTKKRKRSCLTVDTPAASFPDNQVQHKRLKAAHDNSRCNETPSGDSAAEMSDSERVLQYKASGDQRETESRRSYAEMEHMRRKYMSARPRCDSLKRDEERKTGDAVDAVVSKATDCIRKNENSDVESDKRTARAESGMPSTLSVFTRRCMQKMERDRLGLEESKKQQQTVLGESTTNNHDTVYSKLRRSDNEGIIKPGKQKDEICHSSVGKLVKPGVASSVKPHTNGSFVEKNEPSIEVGDEKRSAVSGICEPSTVAATAAAVPELDSDVSSRRHRENVPASSESVAVRIKSSNRDLASAERVSHEQASLVCHNAASGTAVSSESKQLNSTDENTARASCRTENTSKVYGSSCANAALATIGSAVTDVAVPSADVGHSQPRVYSSAIRRVKKKRTADTSGDKPVSENQVDAQLSIKTDDLSSSFNSKPGKKIPTAFVVESSNRDANFTESCKNSDKDTDQWAAKVAAVETSPLPVSARSSEDILKRLEDLLSTPTQTSGAQVTTSNLIGPTRVDPRLAAKQMREGGGAAERVLSPLGILNSLVAATGNQSTVSDRSELSVCSSSNVKQPPVHNDKFSTEALKISADAKRVDVQVCQTTSGCNSPTLPVTDTELRGAVTRFRDPRDRSMQVGETERLSKILEPNSSSSNRQAPNDDCSARLKNFEDAVKALKRCVSSPCKTESCTAEKIPSVLTENSHQRKNLRLDSATDHNTLTANNATTAEAVTSVDLLDFAIAGTPVDCNDSIAGSVRSPALDSDLCLMNVEDTEIGADDNCDITVMQTFAADDSKSGAAAVSLFADESDSDLGISEIPVKQVCVAAASDVCSDNDGSSRLSMTGELTGSEGVNDKTLTPGSEPFRIFRRSGSSLADEGCDMLRGETLPKIGDDDGLIAERKSESDGSRKGSSGSAAAKRPVFYAGDAFSDVEPSDDPCTDVEPSDSDFDGTGRVRVDEQRRSDSKQSTRLLEELSWSPEPTSAADMRQPSDGNESAALGNGGTSPESVLGSRAHFVGRDENAEEDGVLDLHYFDREPLLLMDEGNNTMDRLFGLVSDSDAESPGKAAAPAAARDPSPPRVVVALQPRPSACDIEDGEVTDSDTEHVQSSGRRGGDYDGRQKDGNFTANRVRKLPAKRSTVGSSPSDERKPDKPERHRTKHVDQSATEWRQKSSDVVRRHHSHSDNEHGNDRHPDARRDRKPSRDNERRERQTSLSRKAQSVGGSSRGGNSHGDQRSPLRTRTAENVHRSSVEDRTVTEYAAGSKRKGNVKSGRKKNKNNNRK